MELYRIIFFTLISMSLLFPSKLFAGDTDLECERVKKIEFTPQDRPTATEKKALDGCKSEVFYYGIRQPVNFVKARHCAFIEMDSGEAPIFGGQGILMMLYANGQGINRNIDLAIKMVCSGFYAAPAEKSGAIEMLIELGKKDSPEKTKQNFDICDAITSSFMMGACDAHSERVNEGKRTLERAALIEKWPQPHQQAFRQLEKQAREFFTARMTSELALDSASAASIEYEEQGKLNKDFDEAITAFEQQKFPTSTIDDFKKANLQLDSIYTNITQKKEQVYINFGSYMVREKIKASQKKWLNYRDSWVAFSAIRYPKISADTWKTWLTQKRIQMLEGTLESWNLFEKLEKQDP
jgi:hypothetical protein